jgi:hypothetical protein
MELAGEVDTKISRDIDAKDTPGGPYSKTNPLFDFGKTPGSA